MNQSEFETLMMAHDNLQRELSDIKRLMGKDKHALIKSNIALTSKVNRLEDDLVEQMECFEELQNNHIRVSNQNKRYREVIEFGIEYLKNSDIRQVQLVVTALKSALEESK